MRWFFMLSLGFLTACGGGSSSDLDGGPAGFAPSLSVDGAVVSSQPVAISIEENSTLVASVSSSAGNLSLSADLDGALFEISAEGQLSFRAPWSGCRTAEKSEGTTLRQSLLTTSTSSMLTISTIIRWLCARLHSGSVVQGWIAQ